MFSIGDKIVYPMQGAGVIIEIREERVLGEFHRYYILRVPLGGTNLMVPVDTCENIGVRRVVSPEKIEEMLTVLRSESTEMSDSWNRRYRANLDLLRTGDICQVAAVIRNLMRSDRIRKLSAGEKKMLANARHILVSEMILVKGMDRAEAEQVILAAVNAL
ncbi:MAG: CarD family transcriptional regulator [Clostridiales bacterium]|nr:CarD family transcriptional regulator [Clostridiales bacterium]